MADVHEPKTRSYNMSQIKATDTKPEMIVRKYLHSQGFRYRLHVKDLPGKPDLVLPKYKTVIFVHGCFWHAHEGCEYFKMPKSRIDYWKPKLLGNRERDQQHYRKLNEIGWEVIIIWECELKSEEIGNTLHDVIDRLTAY